MYVLRLRVRCEHGEWCENFKTQAKEPLIALRQIEMLLKARNVKGSSVVGFAWDYSPSSFENAKSFPPEL